MEHSLLNFKTIADRPTDPTKINIITFRNIPKSTLHIADLTFLTMGLSLNMLIILVILLKSSMRTSNNFYIISLACSSLVILMEPFQKQLDWFFDIHMILNMDYVCLVNFNVTILTIAILNLQMYISIFHRKLPIGEYMLLKSTSIKGVLLIWCINVMFIAIELHIYDFFKGVMDEIYIWTTFMFTIMPCIIFFVLDSLIFYELAILKAIEGSWRRKELRDTLMLVSVKVVFLLTLVPYRFARAINFIAPKAACCTENKREVLYLIVKTFPIIFPIIYIVAASEFHHSLKEILCCRCRKNEEEIAAS